jgi:O-acetyl-ADP-ribose deacetylase
MDIGKTKLTLKRGDITKEIVDAIVNAANSSLCGGGGVDGAIHRTGGPSILEQCRQIAAQQGKCPPGEAVVTGAGLLGAKYIVHTVGPIWRGGKSGEEKTLSNAYRNSLTQAAKMGARTIAFPSISTGAYGYPVELAARTALSACISYARENKGFDEIRFILFSETDLQVYQRQLSALDDKPK